MRFRYSVSILLLMLLACVMPHAAAEAYRVGSNESPEWLASLYLTEGLDKPEVGPYCRASLISNKWLLTAAHCVDFYQPSDIQVSFGLQNRDKNNYYYFVETVLVHPDWNSNSLENDIALIELTEEVTLQPLELASVKRLTEHVLISGAASAFGVNGRTTDQVSQFYLMNNEQCQFDLTQAWRDKGKQLAIIELDDSMLCARATLPDEGTCEGDSGGPLVIFQDNRWYQLGLVSWSYGCSRSEYHSVFTRASSFSDWIGSVLHGVVLPESFNFGLLPQGFHSRQKIKINNNGSLTVSLVGSIENDTDGVISLIENNCIAVLPGTDCHVELDVYAEKPGTFFANFVLADEQESFRITSRLSAEVLSKAPKSVSSNQKVTWFSSDPNGWEFLDGKLSSPDSNQEAYALALINGEGMFSFQVESKQKNRYVCDGCNFIAIIADNKKLEFKNDSKRYFQVPFTEPGFHSVLFSWQPKSDSQPVALQVEVENIQLQEFSKDKVANSDSLTEGGGSLFVTLILLLLSGIRKNAGGKPAFFY